MEKNPVISYGLRLLKVGLSLNLMLGSWILPTKAETIFQENFQGVIEQENQQREIADRRRRENFGRYCVRPRLRIRARNIEVKRIYRYSIYCRKEIVQGWQLWQRGYHRNNKLRVYIYDRRGVLLEKRELRLKRYDRNGKIKTAKLFVTSNVGVVKIERINSNRGNSRYGRRNRRESDEDDDDDD